MQQPSAHWRHWLWGWHLLTRQLTPPLPVLPNSLQSAVDWPICVATQDTAQSCNLPSEDIQIMRLVKTRKQEGDPVLQHPVLPSKLHCRVQRSYFKRSRKQLLENNLWTRKVWLLEYTPQLGAVVDFPGFHREQRSRLCILKCMAVRNERQGRTDC